MKKVLTGILTLITAVSFLSPTLPALATETPVVSAIMINDQALDLHDLPVAPYPEGNTIMVPLRKIGEALGYNVRWNTETKTITVDDHSIQKATLFPGTTTVTFEGRLKIINLNRELETAAQTVVHAGLYLRAARIFSGIF